MPGSARAGTGACVDRSNDVADAPGRFRRGREERRRGPGGAPGGDVAWAAYDRGVTERVDYDGDGLSESAMPAHPFEQVRRWVDEAVARQHERGDVAEPLSLSVATVDAAGSPNVRTVLMRFLDERGPGFVTTLTSAKGRELGANPRIAAAFTWAAMYRAIRFRGRAAEISREEITSYFETRPYGSRISAWASRQSDPVGSRRELEEAFARYAARWPELGAPGEVPVPDFWGGYRVVPDEVEFWAGRKDRLHDRLVYTRVAEGTLADPAAWRLSRRQP